MHQEVGLLSPRQIIAIGSDKFFEKCPLLLFNPKMHTIIADLSASHWSSLPKACLYHISGLPQPLLYWEFPVWMIFSPFWFTLVKHRRNESHSFTDKSPQRQASIFTLIFPTRSIFTGANTVGPSLSERKDQTHFWASFFLM